MMYTIYLIRCSANSKVYIGQTARQLHTRFQEHLSQANKGKTTCRKLYAAIRKYGDQCFSIEILYTSDTQQEADFKETELISKCDSIKNGYNLQVGGYNGKPSEETRKLMSEQKAGEKNPMFGKHHSQSVRDTISTKNKGKPSYWKGKEHLPATIEKISASRKGLTTGEQNPGAKLTLDQVVKIRALLQSSNLTRQEIANQFNVSLSTIKRIKAGTHWK